MPGLVAMATVAWFGRTVELQQNIVGLLDTSYDDPGTAIHFGGPVSSTANRKKSQPMFPPVVFLSDWNASVGGYSVGYKHNISFRGQIVTGTFYVVFRPRYHDYDPYNVRSSVIPLYTQPRVSDNSGYWKWTASTIDRQARERALYLQARPDPFVDSRKSAKERPVTIDKVLAFTPYGERSAALDNFNTPDILLRGVVNAAPEK